MSFVRAVDVGVSPPEPLDWHVANQRYLSAALAVVRALVEQHAARAQRAADPGDAVAAAQRALEAAARAMPEPAAIEGLCRTLGLSPFEREVLLLAAAVELDSTFAACCADAQGDARRTYPTFSLALAALPEAHWSALMAASPLRRFRLIEVMPGDALTVSPLRIDERVLHYLAGMQRLDERLVALLVPVPLARGPLPPSHAAIVARIAALWTEAMGSGPLPVVQLTGPAGAGRHAIAAAACAEVGSSLNAIPAHLLGGGLDELAVAHLLTREAALGGAALLIECDDLEVSDAARALAVGRLLDRTGGPVLVASRDRRRLGRRAMVTFEVQKPSRTEQRALWIAAIVATAAPPAPAPDEPGLAAALDALVSQFDLGAAAIQSACATALSGDRESLSSGATPSRALWDACRFHARPRLDDLAQRVVPAATWADLVLPEAHLQVLREMAIHVRQRTQVYERWGFAAKGARGLGISALFSGASGTGKTMAAEVLAGELRLDLYSIDLSQVVSKYIGETEKNLRRIFDAAEDGAAVLLFDEADALFGKRSEVKDSHDRYANIEVGYLLQRMEAFRGLAILTTNMKSAIDTAFLRRIRFVVQFLFPTAPQRAEIWRRVFPAETPTEGLDPEKLARMNVAGGNIRNIALNAAFLAAEAGQPVRMPHVVRAAQIEYSKLERPLTVAELEA